MAKSIKKKRYQVRITVWEYYDVEATSAKKAAEVAPVKGGPFMVLYRSSKVTRSRV
jgi:hypothetical protein